MNIILATHKPSFFSKPITNQISDPDYLESLAQLANRDLQNRIALTIFTAKTPDKIRLNFSPLVVSDLRAQDLRAEFSLHSNFAQKQATYRLLRQFDNPNSGHTPFTVYLGLVLLKMVPKQRILQLPFAAQKLLSQSLLHFFN